MTIEEFVREIAVNEHMGKVPDYPNIDVTRHHVNTVRVHWDATFEGEKVRQYAEFKFTGICLKDV